MNTSDVLHSWILELSLQAVFSLRSSHWCESRSDNGIGDDRRENGKEPGPLNDLEERSGPVDLNLPS